ncbi:carboxypeptidase regulatory-like domain-containing protein [bacterium]|nr:carboxypeptidase regulatory-like domain-containing protein [bacterium]
MRRSLSILLSLFLVSVALLGVSIADTSVARLKAAYEAGEISADDYYYYTACVVRAPERVPERFQSQDPINCGTPLLLEVYNNLEEVSPQVRTAITDILARPTGLDNTHNTTHFKLHYTLTGTDRVPNEGYVVNLGTYFETAYNFIITTMGYLVPPSDGSSGGDSRYDIYIFELPGGIMGYCQPEWGGSYAWNDAISFVAMENDYAEFWPWTPTNCSQLTSMHEYFHSVQMAYDYTEPTWWLEVNSTWIEDEYYPTVDMELYYLDYFFDYPEVSLTVHDGEHEYGSYPWNKYLDMRFGRNSIRSIWEECRYANVFSATQTVLSGLGSDRNTAFCEFVEWNYFTDSRATGEHYNDAADFPLIDICATHSSYPASGDAGSHAPSALASNYIRFNIPGTAEGPFTITFDGADGYIWNAQVLKIVTYEDYSKESVPLNTYNYGHLEIPQAVYETLDHIILIPTVLSTGGEDLYYSYSANFETVGPELNPPRNLEAVSGLPGQVPLSWDPPEGAGGVEEIFYDDLTVSGYYGDETGDIEAVRFTPTSACSVKYAKLWVYDGGGTYPDIEVHIWQDDGGIPDPGTDLCTPITISPNALPESTWVDFTSRGVYIDPPMDFHIGIVHLTGFPSLLADADDSGEDRSHFYSSSDDTWYMIPADYLLRAYVKYETGTGPTQYSVYRSTRPGTGYGFLSYELGLSYVDASVTDGIPYYYVVTANYIAGESPYSNEASATPGGGSHEFDTLLVDDGEPETTVWGGYTGARFGNRLSPDSLCQVLSLEFLTYNFAETARDFFINCYEWTGSRVGNELLPPYWRATAYPGLNWTSVDIASYYDLYLSNDFIAAMELISDTSLYICFDDENTGLSWDYLGTAWAAADITYYIRAVVRYISSDETFSLRGYVDLPGRSDMSGSVVEIQGLGAADTTDETGNYWIESIPVGTYTVTADHFGYEEQSARVSMHGDQRQNFTLVGIPTPIYPPEDLMALSYFDGRIPLIWTPPKGEPGTNDQIFYFNDTTETYWYPEEGSTGSGDIEETRFMVWFPCSLEYVSFLVYDPRGSYRDIELHIWEDDGDGFPDLESEIMTPDTIEVDSFPYLTFVDYTGEGIVFEPGQIFHVGQVKLNQYPSILADDSALADTVRSHQYLADETAWFQHAEYIIIIGVKYFQMELRMASESKTIFKPAPKVLSSRHLPSVSIPAPDEPVFEPERLFGRMAPTSPAAVEDYYIYRSEEPDGPFFYLGFTDSTLYIDSTITNGELYYYYVTAFHPRGESETTDTVSARALAFHDTADVLLIDDDGSVITSFDDQAKYYLDALDENDVVYNAYEIIGWDSLFVEDLAGYKAVIWFMGVMYRDSLTLTTWDEHVLGEYLDGGGSLFLVSQDYLWDRYTGSPFTFLPGDFPLDYLGVDRVDQDEWTIQADTSITITGDESSLAAGMTFGVTNPFSNWRVFPDDITHSSVDLFHLTGPGVTGGVPAIQYASSFRSVFSTIPLGALEDGPYPSTKTELIRRILVDYFDIYAPEGSEVVYDLITGWHMLSVPVECPSRHVNVVFPGHTGNVWGFNPQTGIYEPADTVEIGKAYWVLYLHDTTYALVGAPAWNYETTLEPSWHMIGAPYSITPQSISMAATDPPGTIMDGSLYRYQAPTGPYVATDSIDMPLGYWILVTDTCTFTFPEITTLRRVKPRKEPEFEFKMNFDNNYEIELGYHKDAHADYDPEFDRLIPPFPPMAEEFVYLVNEDGFNYSKNIVRSSERIEWTLRVDVQSPVEVNWETPELNEGDKLMITGKGKSVDLNSVNEVTLNSGIYKVVYLRSNIPSHYYINQNFPNPFNACTWIDYGLPEDGHVSLEIYNILGYKVRTLVDGAQDAGRKTAMWDGLDENGSTCSAGIYFYTINAGNYKTTKRMLILK